MLIRRSTTFFQYIDYSTGFQKATLPLGSPLDTEVRILGDRTTNISGEGMRRNWVLQLGSTHSQTEVESALADEHGRLFETITTP